MNIQESDISRHISRCLRQLKEPQRIECIYQTFSLIFSTIFVETDLVNILYTLWWGTQPPEYGYFNITEPCLELPTNFFVDFLCKLESNRIAETIAQDISNAVLFFERNKFIFNETIIKMVDKPIECLFDVLCIVTSMEMNHFGMFGPGDIRYHLIKHNIENITQLLVKRGLISFCNQEEYVCAENDERIIMICSFFKKQSQDITADINSYSDEKENHRPSAVEYYFEYFYNEYKHETLPKLIEDINNMIYVLRQNSYYI